MRVCLCDLRTSSSDSLCCPTGSVCVVSKGNCRERVGEVDAERRGCSHIFCSGLLACLMAVCVSVCVSAEHAGGDDARCHYAAMRTAVCLYACTRVPKQRVESVVVYSLTVTDKYTLTTGVKKLNALCALFSPWRLHFFCPRPSHFYFLYFSLSYSPAFALSLAVSFYFSPLPPSFHL